MFLKEFHVAPKILNELAIVATQFFISPETLVKAFHIENTQYFLKKEHPILEGILAEVVLPKDNFKKFIEKPYIFDLIQCYLKYVKTKDIGYKNTIDWIIKHPNINNTFINTLLEQAKNMKEIKDTMTLNEVSMEIARYQNLGEIAKIEQRYKDAGFKFSDCVFNLKYTEAETEKYMQSQQGKNTVKSTTDAKIDSLIKEALNSAEVRAEINAGVEKGLAGRESLVTLKMQLDEYNKFYTGLNDYANGVGSIYGGILTVKNGLPALTNGIAALRDGAGRLADGITEFTKAVTDKLGSAGDVDLAALAERLKATLKASESYNSFSGLGDGMTGSVKFIFRTDSIGQ